MCMTEHQPLTTNHYFSMMDRHAAYAARHEAIEWLKFGQLDLAEVALRDAKRLMPKEKVQVLRLNSNASCQPLAYSLQPEGKL